MVNLWGTWCTPCKKELPELAAMAADFETQGGQIIGICHDSHEEGKTELAVSLLADAGVGYLNLAAPDHVEDIIPSTGLPTTIFVDSEGKLLAEPISGAYVEEYPVVFAELLAEFS